MIFEDQLSALESDSKRVGTQGQEIDFALLVDGLAAEREQGITIDVAYRYFQTPKRAFIVADTPGHEQYTRNMATGASTAELAVLLVDARAGLLEQTRRHAAIVHLMGIRQVILAVNKIDLVGYDRAVFDDIELEFRAYAAKLGEMAITAIPLSALKGENIVTPARETLDWYSGPTLIEAYTYRMGAHTSSDDPTRYRDTADLEAWRARDPISRVADHLRAAGILTTEVEDRVVRDQDPAGEQCGQSRVYLLELR